MRTSSMSLGLIVAVMAAATFGTSGAFVKPLLDAGWSPAAAVTVRALVGGVVLAPFAVVALRGRWASLWRGRWRVIGMALIGVAGTQLAYFAALERIPVGTAILIEYMAPLLLVGVAWALTRRTPKAVVLAGSVIALAGLALVVSPDGGPLDPVGILLAVIAMVGCAVYYVVAARPADGLPPVALAASGLLVGALALGATGASGLVAFELSAENVTLFSSATPWWVPMLVVGVVSTAIAYAASLKAAQLLGSRLASFAGLLEVVAATFYAWLLLGEQLTPLQLLGGVLILVGIGFVRSEKSDAESRGVAEVRRPTEFRPGGRLRSPRRSRGHPVPSSGGTASPAPMAR